MSGVLLGQVAKEFSLIRGVVFAPLDAQNSRTRAKIRACLVRPGSAELRALQRRKWNLGARKSRSYDEPQASSLGSSTQNEDSRSFAVLAPNPILVARSCRQLGHSSPPLLPVRWTNPIPQSWNRRRAYRGE